MSLWATLQSLLGGKIDKIVDEAVTSTEERLEAKRRILEVIPEVLTSYEDILTSRHKTDMQSDSWLSKNIRPMVLIWVIVCYMGLALTDGNLGQFEIDDQWVEMIKSWGGMAFMFYFGGRSAEKIFKMMQNKKGNL